MMLPLDDPMPSEPARPGYEWWKHDVFGTWQQIPVKKPSGQTPHAKLKLQCRDALTGWRQRHGVSVVLLPSIVGKIRVGGRNGKDIGVGVKGQADDTLIVWGHAIGIEYKAGRDVQSPIQKRFQERWEAAGGTYVLARSAKDLTDALDQLAAQRGKLF